MKKEATLVGPYREFSHLIIISKDDRALQRERKNCSQLTSPQKNKYYSIQQYRDIIILFLTAYAANKYKVSEAIMQKITKFQGIKGCFWNSEVTKQELENIAPE